MQNQLLLARFALRWIFFTLLLLVAAMALEERQCDLHEDLPDEVFIDPLLLLLALLDQLSQVPALAVFHHDVERGLLLVHDLVVAPHYVLVLQFAQDVDFVY